MDNAHDNSNAIIRPPIAWALAFIVGLGLDWLQPMPFVPAFMPAAWLGTIIFALGFGLAIWAIITIRQAGSRVETNMPTTTIVMGGPYRFTRNPIYVAMFLGQGGLAVGFNSLWLLLTLVLFYFVIRYGVVAREEAYLERKFPTPYLDYKSRVHRWL
ncbi:MAG: isoprenylcysteine carboxylmethyltransferase family protein [Hyphomicrobiaceae bacterium]